jgi:hypothetical protein
MAEMRSYFKSPGSKASHPHEDGGAGRSGQEEQKQESAAGLGVSTSSTFSHEDPIPQPSSQHREAPTQIHMPRRDNEGGSEVDDQAAMVRSPSPPDPARPR